MGTPTQVCVWYCPNFSALASRPFRCVRSKVCDWYWKRKDVTQWDWVEMNVGETGGRVGRGGGRGRGPRIGNDERVDELNGQGNDQGLGANRGVEGVNGNAEGANGECTRLLNDHCPAIAEPLTRHASSGCSYKDFLACNPKEYDGKGGAVVCTRWIEKMKSVDDMSGCSTDQKVKYTVGSFVGKALTWWNSHIYTRSREIVVDTDSDPEDVSSGNDVSETAGLEVQAIPRPFAPLQIIHALPALPRRPAILVRPRQVILFSRPYRIHPNGVRMLLTARKRVRAPPVLSPAIETAIPQWIAAPSPLSLGSSLGSSSAPSSPHSGPSRKRSRPSSSSSKTSHSSSSPPPCKRRRVLIYSSS
ncbi:hypothetical protein Tco_0901635 [Tanacetum coccineum]